MCHHENGSRAECYTFQTDGDDAVLVIYTNEALGFGNLTSETRFDGELWQPSYYHFDALGSTRDMTPRPARTLGKLG